MICPKCGASLPKEAKFCLYCGQKINGGLNKPQQNATLGDDLSSTAGNNASFSRVANSAKTVAEFVISAKDKLVSWWTNKPPKKRKTLVTWGCIAVCILFLYTSCASCLQCLDEDENYQNDDTVVVTNTDETSLSTLTTTTTTAAATTTATTTKSAEEIRREFIDSCEEYSFEELSRYPDKYIGEHVTFYGEILQVLEDGNYVEIRLDIYENDDYEYYDDTIYVFYTLKAGEARLLEGDIIGIYGVFEGLISYESIMGATITLPAVDAKYLDLYY